MSGPASYASSPEEIVRAVSRAMLRGSALIMLAVLVGAVVVAWAVVGPAGGVSALLGGGSAVVLSLFTLFLISRAATLEPRAAMAAAMSGLMFKVIALIAVYALVSRFGTDVHRESLALSMVAVFVVAAAAQSFAASRVRMLTVVPEQAPEVGGDAPDRASGMSGASGSNPVAPTARGARHANPGDAQ